MYLRYFDLYIVLVCISVIILRKTEPNSPRPIKAFGYPVLPALFIMFCVVLVISSIIKRPEESIYGLLLIGSGLPFYLIWSKNSKADKVEA